MKVSRQKLPGSKLQIIYIYNLNFKVVLSLLLCQSLSSVCYKFFVFVLVTVCCYNVFQFCVLFCAICKFQLILDVPVINFISSLFLVC